ncbi:hypothetical protein TNCV_2835531 [Trichonephila clavipes]|uniref:Uncharacterized protein n=1 Tax=Trichonephila clavipes TaxID=2585209 RepID=A0A8X6RTZ9_TRICX|nr:hypothetical protein TNCV_2835531 [Trichonephila clavipes]
MCVSYTHWQPKPSQKVQVPCVNIECKKMTSVFFKDFRRVNDHQKAKNTTRTRLKNRYATPVLSFLFQNTRIAVSLYAALSREAKVMLAVLTVDRTGNAVAPYE